MLTDFAQLEAELNRPEFRYVVPDFRLNKAFDRLNALPDAQKRKVEFLCNECCWFACPDRKACYENVSRKNLGEDCPDHVCASPYADRGYRFSDAMKNPGFIGIEDIQDLYLPGGFSHFKIEGRSLGSAVVLEFLLYYMTKPEYQLKVREEIYLDSMLDLFCAKKLWYVTTAGGFFIPEEFGFGYVKSLAQNYYGIQDVELVQTGGLDIDGADVESIMRKAMDKLTARFEINR